MMRRLYAKNSGVRLNSTWRGRGSCTTKFRGEVELHVAGPGLLHHNLLPNAPVHEQIDAVGEEDGLVNVMGDEECGQANVLHHL